MKMKFEILEIFNWKTVQKRKPDNQFGIVSYPQNYDTHYWQCLKVLRTKDKVKFIKDFTYTDKGLVIGFKFYGDYESKRCIVFTSSGDFDIDSLNVLEQPKYTDTEVLSLLIRAKDKFGGSELYDYTPDEEVITWFEQIKK
jgi:hypothetical protein